MGAKSSIHKKWDVQYHILGIEDSVINHWRVSFRGWAYVAILIVIGMWTFFNAFSRFARRKRKLAALNLLAAESKRNGIAHFDLSHRLRRPGLAKLSPNGSTETLPAYLSRANSLTTMDANPSYSPRSQASPSAKVSMSEKASSSEAYEPVARSASSLQWAALQSFGRTSIAWRKISFGPLDAALSELFWFGLYLGLMLLLGFLYLPETTQFDNTNVTIHRCSSLTVSQLPFVIALAGKNNVMAYITGISYERFNFLHRNAARTLWVFILYHAGGHLYCGMTGLDAWDQAYVAAGVAAFLAFSMIVLSSFRAIRNRWFEAFFYIHIVCVPIFIICTLLHRLEYKWWIAASLAIYLSDRILRLLRLLVLNRFQYLFHGSVLKQNMATIENHTSDLLSITIHKDVNWQGGKHAFLCFPTISTLPWEMHPFSIGLLHRLDAARTPEIKFFVRVREGMTRQLAEDASRKGGLAQIPCLLDGPYGTVKNLDHFDEVLLFSGGTGISYTMNRLSEIATKKIDGDTAVRKVVFVYVARNVEQIEPLSELLLEIQECTPPGFLDLQLYITDKSFGEKKRSKLGPLGFKMRAGRPHVQRILWQNIMNTSNQRRKGLVAVHCCGPTPLTDSVRSALADMIDPADVASERAAAVDFHAEMQG